MALFPRLTTSSPLIFYYAAAWSCMLMNKALPVSSRVRRTSPGLPFTAGAGGSRDLWIGQEQPRVIDVELREVWGGRARGWTPTSSILPVPAMSRQGALRAASGGAEGTPAVVTVGTISEPLWIVNFSQHIFLTSESSRKCHVCVYVCVCLPFPSA